MLKLGSLFLLFFLLNPCPAKADNSINFDRLANAIFKAENSKTHPYGILKPYCTAQTIDKCRKGCMQTIANAFKRWQKTYRHENFILYLSRTYAPLNAKNDPSGLNKHWIKNVNQFYKEES